MAEASNEFDIDDLRFVRVRPSQLLTRDYDSWCEISELRTEAYKRVFTEQTDEEVGHFVGSLTPYSWDNPNVAVGRGLRARQRYAKPRVVAALDKKDDRLVGYAYGANNASSKKPGIRGIAERTAKLHVPFSRFESARYFWLREVVPIESERVGLPIVLGALLLRDCKPHQPVTCYPWSEESALRQHLTAWGFEWDGDTPEPERPFGTETTTLQVRWIAKRAGDVIRNIVAIPGVAEAVPQAESL